MNNQQLSEELKEKLRAFDVVELGKREQLIDKILEYVASGKEITPIIDILFQAGVVKTFPEFRQITKAAEQSAFSEINGNSQGNKVA